MVQSSPLVCFDPESTCYCPILHVIDFRLTVSERADGESL
jgi:hypothetical protein